MIKIFGEKDEFEKNGFKKFVKKDRKVVISVLNKNTKERKTNFFPFETNIVQSIPGTDAIFALACEENNDHFVSFLTNIDYNYENPECASPTRTAFPGLTEKYGFFRYMYEYGNKEKLKIDSKGDLYYEISIESEHYQLIG